MLQIVGGYVLRADDYCIIYSEDGMDEIRWKVSINDPDYPAIREGVEVVETTTQQRYRVVGISSGTVDAEITGALDLDEWRERLHLGYKSYKRTAYTILQAVCPEGWTLIGDLSKPETLNIEMQGPTDLEVAMQVQERFGCRLRFDVWMRTVEMIYPQDEPVSNGYIIDTVNLRSAPVYRGTSHNVYTRIYPIGKDGLTIEKVNGGKPYLDEDGADRTVSVLWKDERYDSAQSLMEAARAKLRVESQPERSWTLDVVDLHAVDPDRWSDMEMPLFRRVRLIDQCHGTSEIVQVVRKTSYPYYPERNKLAVSTATAGAGLRIRQIAEQIKNANSELWQRIGGYTFGNNENQN